MCHDNKNTTEDGLNLWWQQQINQGSRNSLPDLVVSISHLDR